MSVEATRTAPNARLVVLWGDPSDPDAFEHHYREVHIPLGRQLPGLRRYSLSRAMRGVRGEQYYLVATLEWDDLAALHAAFESEIGRVVAADVSHLTRFADVRSMIFELDDLVR